MTTGGLGTQQGTEPPVLAALRDVGKAISSVRDVMAFETNPQVLGDAMCELVELGTDLDAVRIELVAQCQTNAVPDTVEVRTMGQYVAARTNHPAKDTNHDTRLAKWLLEFPLLARALADRTSGVTVAHLEFLRTKIDNERTHDLLRTTTEQEFFVDNAPLLGFDGFVQAAKYWLIVNDPDGKEPTEQLDNAGVSITVGAGGSLKITIESDAVHGHAFVRMIDHETRKLRREDNETGVERTTRQRRHTAVFNLMEKGFRLPDGTHPIPLINLVMSQKVAEWATDKVHAMADPDYELELELELDDKVPVHPLDIDGRCEFIDGRPVHPLLIAAGLGFHRFDTPTLRRYIMTADDRIIDYSYNARIAPEHLRTACHIQHRGRCSIPGCDAPHEWLQIDHVHPESRGGPTSLRNTEPKCEADNQAKGNRIGDTPVKDRPPIRRHRRPTLDDDDDDDDLW